MSNSFQVPVLARAAAVLPQSVNEADRTVELTFTTGALVRRFDWYEGEYEEELVVAPEAMRMERMNAGAPLLADHNQYEIDDVRGVIERAWIQDGEGRCVVRFAKDEKSESTWQKVRDGILRNISVGYMVHAYQEIKDGARRILRAVDWEPMEVSLVCVPADARAQVRSAEAKQFSRCIVHRTVDSNQKGQPMTTETTTTEETTAPAEETAAPAADAPAADTAPADEPAVVAGGADTRAEEIMELCVLAQQPMSRALEFVKAGKTAAQVRAALLAERDKKITGQDEIRSVINPPAEQKTGGTAERMAQRFAKADGQKQNLAQRMANRFSA